MRTQENTAIPLRKCDGVRIKGISGMLNACMPSGYARTSRSLLSQHTE